MLEETIASLRDSAERLKKSLDAANLIGHISSHSRGLCGRSIRPSWALSAIVHAHWPRRNRSIRSRLIDRFGPLPQEVENLLEVIAVKQLCRIAGVEQFDAGPKGAVLAFRNNTPPNPERLIGYIQKHTFDQAAARPESRLQDWSLRISA